MKKALRRNSLIKLVKRELKKEKVEKNLIYLLLVFTIIPGCFLLFFLISNVSLTGYNVAQGSAGYITEMNIYRSFSTEYWGGLYGLALRVPDFTEQLYGDFNGAEILRQDVFFNCMQEDATGGKEVYASNSPVIDFDTLEILDPSEIDALTGCSNSVQCAVNTFTEEMSVMVGDTNITNIPSTHTFRYDGSKEVFNLGILKDSSGNFVYVSNVQDIQRSYNYEKIVNFQMILPIPENSSERYYFFTDPYDECPAGSSLGANVDSNVYGYVFDENGEGVGDVEINVAGEGVLSNSDGSYFLNFTVIPGTYNLFASKTSYDNYFANLTINFSNYSIAHNITLLSETPSVSDVIVAHVYGYVFDEAENILSDAEIRLGDINATSNALGYYSISSPVTWGLNPILGIKEDYGNYYSYINLTNSTPVYHNITLNLSYLDYNYLTGPYTQAPSDGDSDGKYDEIPKEVLTTGEDYWISTQEINKEVRKDTFVTDYVGIYNLRKSPIDVTYVLSSGLEDFVSLDKVGSSLAPGDSDSLKMTFYGIKPLGEYNGTLSILGDLNNVIPINIKIVDKKFPVEVLLMDIGLEKNSFSPKESLKYKLNFQNLLRDQNYQISLKTKVKNFNGTEIYSSERTVEEISHSLTLLNEFELPENISEGNYVIEVEAKYLNLISTATASFSVVKPIYMYSFFGVPLWIIFAIISFFSFSMLNLVLYRKYRDRNKRYKIGLDYSTLAKPGDRVVNLGLIAETKHPAYYDIDKLTTHAIVAGATGMGKSISSQVIIEEALKNNISVVVFDPTAQWSGMLRKCTDKKMISYYPKFGLKERDAMAFKGNVRQVQNARQLIDIQKYLNPGQIQIFSLNKLNPKDMDIFVANVIRQIFKSDPKEYPNLKTLIVFDEVHRLLPKFGGSGQGFLQIERACREFRKWGLGVLLISQVLNDFVGEIKANINTEVQTRTLEENDLERIKTKYGDSFLKSLVKAEVGVAMFQNATYNRGRPYFVNFRPILHSTRRLPDEELEKYNNYNDQVDDLEFNIEQLEREKVDTFDLKMELKLIKDKIMSGSFSVVEIYLEGLKPRVAKEFEKIGKTPKKREINLVSEEEILASVKEAEKEKKELVKKENEEREKVEKKEEKIEDKKEKEEEKIEDKKEKESENEDSKEEKQEENKNKKEENTKEVKSKEK